LAKLAVHSAETYVDEPGDLWWDGLPRRYRNRAFVLQLSDGVAIDSPHERPSLRVGDHRHRPRTSENGVRARGVADQGYDWVRAASRCPVAPDDPPRDHFEGTTARGLRASLDACGIVGAVLYPSVAARALQTIVASPVLDAFYEVYNDWILALAADAPERLRAVALLNIDDPAATIRTMQRDAHRGAAGFVLPAAPGEGRRYDQVQYEPVWRISAELGVPLVLLAGTNRVLSESADELAPHPTNAARLAWKATSVVAARRSLTAIIYAGVFERYPTLQIGVAGFDAGWIAYAMVRADEMYEVRPERTGPPNRMPPGVSWRGPLQAPAPVLDVAIAGDDRTGTRGMAPEGFGYHFPNGERFSDHFRRNVFCTFADDDLAISTRRFIGTDRLLWGHGRTSLETEEPVIPVLDALLADVPHRERRQMVSENAARVFNLPTAARRRRAGPARAEAR
jgi:predicted TIM-barrel fold metal-dependent hydrolase